MKCCICQKGIPDGITLYRVNAKGVPGIWACAKHVKQTDAAPVDTEILEIVKIIEKANA